MVIHIAAQRLPHGSAPSTLPHTQYRLGKKATCAFERSAEVTWAHKGSSNEPLNMQLERAMPRGSGLSEPHHGGEKRSLESGDHSLRQLQPHCIAVSTFLKGAQKSVLPE